MPHLKTILIISGEPSGDLHASNLVKELAARRPGLKFFGMGGSRSKAAGVEITVDISGLALVGVVEVIKNISSIQKAHEELLKRVDERRPDLAILVDYPGFNLRLARELKRRSIPIVYYISPQIWAWGMSRIKIIKECVKKIVVFFKFEEELYKKNGVDVEFVGHPLLDIVKITLPKKAVFNKYGLNEDKITVALLPGSRAIEIKRLLPVLVDTSSMIAQRIGSVQFIISKVKDLPLDLYEADIKRAGIDIRLVEDDTYNILASSDFAMVASGTATLETALIGTPLVIIYKTNPITCFLSRLFMRTPFLGLVNIIAGKEIAPEFLQERATPKHIAKVVAALLDDPAALAKMRDDLKRVASSLGEPGAVRRAADAILPLLETSFFTEK